MLRRFPDKVKLLIVCLSQQLSISTIASSSRYISAHCPVQHVNLGHWTNPAAFSHAYSDVREFSAIKPRCRALPVIVIFAMLTLSDHSAVHSCLRWRMLSHNIPCNQTNCKSHFWNIKNGLVMPAQVCRDCSACSRGGVHGIYCTLHHTEHIFCLFREYPWRETSFKGQKREGTFSMEVVHQWQAQIHQNHQKHWARVFLLLDTRCCEDEGKGCPSAATNTL